MIKKDGKLIKTDGLSLTRSPARSILQGEGGNAMSEYRMLCPKNEIAVRGLYSLHYFQFASGYVFSGEKHDFWEMVYIDRGEAEIGAGSKVRRLDEGQLLFHQPDEFHSIWADYASGANIFVISFDCRSRAMNAFRGSQFTLRSTQRLLLSRLIAEGQRVFGPVLDVSEQKELRPLANAPRGGVQMIMLYLTQLLLDLLRDQQAAPVEPARSRLTEEADFADVFRRVRELMTACPDGSLRFSQVCRQVGISSTVFKERFKRYVGVTVMEYYRRLRIEEARRRLRTGEMNIAQVADTLGYSSPAAFSRQFKRQMKLTPREYLYSIRI